MKNLFKTYISYKRNLIETKYSEEFEKLIKTKNNDLEDINMLNEENFTNCYIYNNVDFEFIKHNKKYVKKYIMGFVESNISLIEFGDLCIYSVENGIYKSHEFNEKTILNLVESLLNDNTEYTIIQTKNNSDITEYKIEELNLYFSAFYND